ncbi:MAG: DUF4859 domain-containing protein [Bacteroidaceae bacterium]|nr:DUF4859 domain-containing protein [Bacteroidaceae bacterium]
MKRIFTFMLLLTAFVGSSLAQKTVYIPYEWRQNRTDTLLYKESDPDNKYTWSKSRSIESENVIIFWDKYYGTAGPKALSPSNFYYVDMDDLLQKCEAFFDLEINQLGFVDPVNSNLSRYKVMVLMNHTTTWTCYGGGYDYQVSALWLNPATCKPVGQAVAHEVGHSFHYMCYAEHSGHQDSNSDNTGFHLACGNGQAIWEQTAQWQSVQSYPELMFDQSIGVFRLSHNYAYSHEWHRYQSYWFHYFINQYYNDITTVAQVWNQPMTGQSAGNASDFNRALMALKHLTVRELFALYFDYACRCATWDFDACVPYRNPFIGDFEYRCVLTEDDAYQVALASCPQGTGFNVIPLEVPRPGTEVTTHLTGLPVGSALLDSDPGEYLDGDTRYVTFATRHYVNGGARASRGFRMGYVALMTDGSRRYFSEDSVYCQGTKTVEEAYSFTLPEGVSRLWLVVAPALKTYITHRWDDKIEADDMWPYRFRLSGTDLSAKAKVYATPTLDGRDIADVTFTYDVTFPRSTTEYTGTTVSVSGRANATLGTAFQLKTSSITNQLQDWASQGPANRRIMFYALNADGSLAQRGSTANGYGHWFNASGLVDSYANGYIYSEFNPSALTFTLGQYPNRCPQGATYTVRQALRYHSGKQYALASFVFHVTVGETASVVLRSIDYADPTVGIGAVPTEDYGEKDALQGDTSIYDLSGRRVHHPIRGLYIQNGKKYLIDNLR